MPGLDFSGSTSSLSPVTFSHGTNIRPFSFPGVTTVGAGGGGFGTGMDGVGGSEGWGFGARGRGGERAGGAARCEGEGERGGGAPGVTATCGRRRGTPGARCSFSQPPPSACSSCFQRGAPRSEGCLGQGLALFLQGRCAGRAAGEPGRRGRGCCAAR